jgi:hypothetical protein
VKYVITFVLAILSFMLYSAYEKKPEKKLEDGYRVLSYDAGTHQWTILRTGTFDGKYLRKRLTVICASYKWADHESVTGPEACHLVVGRLLVHNIDPPNFQNFLDVWEMPSEILSITTGTGPDRVIQQFDISKNEVLPDNDSH